MLRGILLKIGATFAFALMWTLVKLFAPAFPVSEIVFFRSIFAMATLAVWLASRGEWPGALKTTRPLGHIGRSIAGSCGMFGSFLALALLPLAVATAFTFATPLMIVPLAAVVLGEEVPLARGLTVALGFVGVLIMLSGQFGEGSASRLGAFIALFAAGSAAVAMIQTRRLVQSEATGAIVFYFSSVTAVVSLVILIFASSWPDAAPFAKAVASQRVIIPGPLAFVGLAALGLLGGCGQIMMTHCYRYADASVIAGFDYVSMVWAAALGYLAFAETISPRVALGAAVVITAGIAMLWRERARRRINIGSAAGKA